MSINLRSQAEARYVSYGFRESYSFLVQRANKPGSNLKGFFSEVLKPTMLAKLISANSKPTMQLHAKLANLCEIYEQIL